MTGVQTCALPIYWCGENEDYIKEKGKLEDQLCGACLGFHERGYTYEDLLKGNYEEE